MIAAAYIDHAATTPVRPEVVDAMTPFFGPRFGNPSSLHRWGRDARAALDDARESVARCINARPDEICFVSGGTEGDDTAVLGAWRAGRAAGRTGVVTTPIEHKAVLGATHQAVREGAEERLLDVDMNGVVVESSFDALVQPDVAICSVMWVNNEIGTQQAIPALARAARDRSVVFHTDAVQAFGKVHIDAAAQPFDLLTISGHKIGAPKGIGALYARRGTVIEPLLQGGGQERGRRPGTENLAFAVALARAAQLAVAEREAEVTRLTRLRDALEAALLERVSNIVVNGRGGHRAPHILNVSVRGADSESLLMMLDQDGIAASSGSACQSGSIMPSHVLTAIGVMPELAACSIRFSLGALTTDEHITRVAEVFPGIVERGRRLAGLAA
jgi:cysteine desulfurase